MQGIAKLGLRAESETLNASLKELRREASGIIESGPGDDPLGALFDRNSAKRMNMCWI
ncbi:MAG: hypothetical protein JO340_15955 [Acidobacteriaceae bacterium]|nr:hypothetical protein [Acidobacteriaceae bacterium]